MLEPHENGASAPDTRLKLHLSGRFHLSAEQTPALAQSPRLQSLLAYLVLHCHEPQPRSLVAFALWPDSSDAQAHTTLRRALYRLRHAWPTSEQFLHVTPTTLHWPEHPALTIDVRQFLAGVAQAETVDELAAALGCLKGSGSFVGYLKVSSSHPSIVRPLADLSIRV